MHEIIHPSDYQKSFHVYFLMGQPEIQDSKLELRLQQEMSTFGDVIRYDQIDNYRQGFMYDFLGKAGQQMSF